MEPYLIQTLIPDAQRKRWNSRNGVTAISNAKVTKHTILLELLKTRPEIRTANKRRSDRDYSNWLRNPFFV